MSVSTLNARLLAARMMRRNRALRIRRLRWFAGCTSAVLLALAWQFRPALLQALDLLQRHRLVACLLVAVASAVGVARHRTLTRAAFTRSWLAALPSRRHAARGAALRIELSPVLAGIAVLTALVTLVEAVLIGVSGNARMTALGVWGWVMGAVVIGAAASYAIPAPKAVTLPPGSRYVPKALVRRGRPLQPALTALGQWPMRQMFARAQPKLVARALMPVLLGMGLGSTADTAMVVIGLFAAAGALSLLIPSVIEVSGTVLGWLTPLPVSRNRLLSIVTIPALGLIIIASAAVGCLLILMDASNVAALCAAVMLALGCSAVMLLGVWWR